MIKMLDRLFFMVASFLFCVQVPSDAVQSHGFEIREVFRNETTSSSNISNKNSSAERPQLSFVLEIDLSTCTCKDVSSTDCGIAIAKSTVLEIPCLLNELYCCSGRKEDSINNSNINALPAPAGDPNNTIDEGRSFKTASISTFPEQLDPTSPLNYDDDEDVGGGEEEEDAVVIDIPILTSSSVSTHKINGNYRLVPVLPVPTNNNNNNNDDDTSFSPPPTLLQPKKRCGCKPRNECPDKYVDLRFGLSYCTHNTTRCCEPEILSPTRRDDTITDEEDDDATILEEEDEQDVPEERKMCHCLPRSECGDDGILDENAPCLMGLVECCRKMVDEEDDPDNYDPPQAIPLPALKIPLSEEVLDEKDVLNRMQQSSSQAAPPQPPPLPTYYNYQSPGHYSGYYNPHQQQQESSNNNPQYDDHNHQQGQQPLQYSNGNNYDNYNNNNQPIGVVGGDQSRSANPDSLFSKLAKIIG